MPAAGHARGCLPGAGEQQGPAWRDTTTLGYVPRELRHYTAFSPPCCPTGSPCKVPGVGSWELQEIPNSSDSWCGPQAGEGSGGGPMQGYGAALSSLSPQGAAVSPPPQQGATGAQPCTGMSDLG